MLLNHHSRLPDAITARRYNIDASDNLGRHGRHSSADEAFLSSGRLKSEPIGRLLVQMPKSARLAALGIDQGTLNMRQPEILFQLFCSVLQCTPYHEAFHWL